MQNWWRRGRKYVSCVKRLRVNQEEEERAGNSRSKRKGNRGVEGNRREKENAEDM